MFMYSLGEIGVLLPSLHGKYPFEALNTRRDINLFNAYCFTPNLPIRVYIEDSFPRYLYDYSGGRESGAVREILKVGPYLIETIPRHTSWFVLEKDFYPGELNV